MESLQEKRKNLLAIGESIYNRYPADQLTSEREDGGVSGLPALFTLDEMFSRIEFDSKSGINVSPYQRFDMISATGPGA